MTLHRVDLRSCPSQPWRNGGGQTRELLAWPDAQAWRVRVSVARIERDGLFSSFPGVRRCFAVLHGAGVELDLPRGLRTLTADDEPVTFDGEAAPACKLLHGPTEDLNLMALREAGTPQLRRAAVGSALDGRLPWRAAFATSPALLDIADRREPMAAGDLLWTDDPDADPWVLNQGQHVHWLWLDL